MEQEIVETPTAPPAPSESLSMISVIERAAMNPDVDIDKMERLLEMQERILAREAEREFHAAMAACQAEIEPVVKNRVNDQTRSRYADLEQIDKVIKPILTKHGFSVTYGQDDCPHENHIRIVAVVSHRGGHSIRRHADIPIDNVGMKGTQNKTLTHATGSTFSYGRRYLKCLIFDVPLADDDGNAAGGISAQDERAINVKLEMERAASMGMQNLRAWWSNQKPSDLALVRAVDYRNAQRIAKEVDSD